MNFNFLKVYKAVTPSLRHTCLLNKSMLWKEKPFNYLCINLIKSRSGRNSDGKCIVYTKKSSKHKTIFRKLDFKYVSFGYVGTIHRIEYDTNRSSFISLVFLKNKMFCYVPYTENTYAGMCIQSVCVSASFFTGDFCMLKYISEGSVVHSLEKTPFYGSSYSRSAGTFSILIKKYIHINKGVVKLKSGEFKLLSLEPP